MKEPGFESPGSAALSGFPAEHCRVVASAAEGDEAYVLLDTGPGAGGYLYGANVVREDGRWLPGSDGNGPGWTVTDPQGALGTLAIGDEAPGGRRPCPRGME